MPSMARDDLAHDLRPLGIAEVEVVGDGDRVGADGGEVAPGLGHRLLAALERIGRPRSAACSREVTASALLRAVHPHDAGVGAGGRVLQRVGHHVAVVLLPEPALGGDVGRGDQRQHRRRPVRRAPGRWPDRGAARRGGSTQGRSIERRVLGERRQRQVADHLAAGGAAPGGRCRWSGRSRRRPGPTSRRCAARRPRGRASGSPASAPGSPTASSRRRSCPPRAAAPRSRSSSMPTPPLPAISTEEEVRPGRAHVLDRRHGARGHQLQRRLDQQLLGEGVADLHGRPLLVASPRRTRPRPWSRRGCRRGRSWSRSRPPAGPRRARRSRRSCRRRPGPRTWR